MRSRIEVLGMSAAPSASKVWVRLHPSTLHGSSAALPVVPISSPGVCGTCTKYSVSAASTVPAGAAKRFAPATNAAGRVNCATSSPRSPRSSTAWIAGVNGVAVVGISTAVTRYSAAAPLLNRCSKFFVAACCMP